MELESQKSMAAEARRTVIWMRRHIRRISVARGNLHNQSRAALRQARKLRARGNVFDSTRIERLEREGQEYLDRALSLKPMVLDWAKTFMRFAPAINAALSLEDLCAILNINQADRPRMAEVDDHGMVSLIAVLGLEDSAQYRRPRDYKAGPMATAISMLMTEFILTTDEGQAFADEQFEPGGFFESVPLYSVGPDGAMKRMPPRLRVVKASCTETDWMKKGAKNV